MSRFLDMLGVDHIRYEPVYADISLFDSEYEVLLCRSANYLNKGETRWRLDKYFMLYKHDIESPLEFCKRLGFEDYIYCMFLVDYLIMNRDRYANNLEILTDACGHVRFAPLFDHGMSLLCNSRSDEEMKAFNVMKDEFSLMFIGTCFVSKNLKLIPKDKWDSYFSLDEPDLSHLFDGIEKFISPVHREKIAEMLVRRLEHLRTAKDSLVTFQGKFQFPK